MKRILLISFCVPLFFSAAQAQFRNKTNRPGTQLPQQPSGLNFANPIEYTIGGIDVVGLNVLDKNAMISLTGLKIGDKIRIPSAATSTAVRKLWKHGLLEMLQSKLIASRTVMFISPFS